jgi:hypothetical protein
MEKESKNKNIMNDAQSEATSQPATPKAKQEELMNFDHWFMVKVSQKKKVQAHHYETIKAFFKKQGLSEDESTTKFDSALKMFGY